MIETFISLIVWTLYGLAMAFSLRFFGVIGPASIVGTILLLEYVYTKRQ
jgi:hypothetical protein